VWLYILSIRELRPAFISVAERQITDLGWSLPVQLNTPIWIAGISIAVVSTIFLMNIYRELSLKIITFFFMGVGLVLTLTSGNLLEVLSFFWLIMVASAVGYQVIGWLGLRDLSSKVERVAWSLTLGLGFLSCFGFILALFHLIYLPFVVTILVLLTLIFFRPLVQFFNDLIRLYGQLIKFSKGSSGLLLFGLLTITGTIFLIAYVKALAPEINFDAAYYQLPIPMIYIEKHGLIEIPYSFRSYFPKGINMQFMLGLLIGGQTTAVLFSTAAVGSVALTTFAFGHSVLRSNRIGILGAALLIAAPQFAWQASTAYIDAGVVVFAFSAIYATFLWRREKCNGWAMMIGMMIGLAMFAKLQAAFLVPSLMIIIVAELRPWENFALFFRRLTWILVPAVILGSAWYIVIFLWTGNPVFPLLNSVFRSPYWAYQNTLFNLRNFGMGYDLLSLLKLPWNLTFHSNFFDEGGVGLVGILPLAAILWPLSSVRVKSHRQERYIMLFVILSFTIIWALVTQYLRYYLVVLPLIALLAASTFENLRTKYHELSSPKLLKLSIGFRSVAILAVFFVCICAFIVYSWWSMPLSYILGEETREAYLERNVPSYESHTYLASNYNHSPVVLSRLPVYDFTTYTPVSQHYLFDDSYLPQLLLPLAENDPGHLAKALDAIGITHVVASSLDWGSDFLATYLLPEYSSNATTVYRLMPDGYARSKIGMLRDGNFEFSKAGHPSHWIPVGTPEYYCDSSVTYEGSCFIAVDNLNYYRQVVTALPQEIYHYSFFTRTDSEGGSLRYQIKWVDEHGNVLNVFSPYTVADREWQQSQGYAIAAPNAAGAIIEIVGNNEAAIFVDKAMLSHVVVDYPGKLTETLRTGRGPTIELWHNIFRCVNSSDRSCLDFLWSS